MIKKILPFTLSLFLLASCAKKTAMVEADSPMTEKTISRKVPMTGDIPIDERVRIGTLKNGMTYYIQKNTKPENRAELRLAVNAGSILEDEDQLGMAHFVEHMAFNGTKHFKKNELVDYLESIGSRFGPDLNAYTSFDETVYMLQVRTDSTAIFNKGMLIMKDWASGITFEHQEIDKERGVVVSEWRSRLSPDQRMQQITFPITYKGSRYAERLPIGEPEIIEKSDYAVFKRFYNDWYRPELMALVVVGDFDLVKIEEQVKIMFSDIPEKMGARDRTKYKVPPHAGTLVAIASDKEASFTNVNVMNKLPKSKIESMADMRTSILRSTYNGMLNARLEEISKEPNPPFIFSYTGYGGDVGDIDSYSSFAMVPEGKASDALERLLLENKRVLDHGFIPSELERQKKRMLESAERRFKEMDKTDSRQLAMRYVYNYLDDNPIPSPAQYLDIMKKYLPTLTLEEINALPQQWVSEDNRVVTITGPEKSNAPLPTETEVRDVLSAVGAAKPEPYVDDVVEGPLLEAELAPVAIVKEEIHEATDITTLELENGVIVYLKPSTFKNDEIIMSANSEGGSSLYDNATYFNASQAPRIIMESGIGKFTSTQLDKLLSGKTVSVFPFIGYYYEGLNGSASPKDVEEMMKLVYLYFTDLREDKEAFDSYITKQIGIYENLKSNPNYYFSDYTSKLKYRNHPRIGFPTESKFRNLDFAKVFELFRDRFADASDFTFTFVGNFEKEEMKVLAQKYLGNLPTVDRQETWKDIGLETFPGQIRKRIKRGEAPKTQVEMFFHGTLEYSPEKAYDIGALLDYMRIKLREELREDKGGVYGVKVSGGASKIPTEKYSITISFNSDPERTDELIEAAKDVIRKTQKELPSAEDLQKVKETQKQSRIKNLEENRFWSLQIMNVHNDEDKTFESILLPSLTKKINGLSILDIKNAATTYFNFQNYMEIVMEPKDKPQNLKVE